MRRQSSPGCDGRDAPLKQCVNLRIRPLSQLRNVSVVDLHFCVSSITKVYSWLLCIVELVCYGSWEDCSYSSWFVIGSQTQVDSIRFLFFLSSEGKRPAPRCTETCTTEVSFLLKSQRLFSPFFFPRALTVYINEALERSKALFIYLRIP